MTKLTGAALDRAVAHAMGLKSVNNCEKWGKEMTEFNDTERESKVKQEIIKNLPIKTQQQVYDELRNGVIEEVLQRIKELRPAIMPLEGMGRGKATHEWFDILVKDIEEMKK
jgi:restriction endonuclease Mrr